MNMDMTTFKPFLLVSLLALALVSSNSVPIRALSKGEIGEHVGLPLPILFLDVQTELWPTAGTTSNVNITLGDEEGNTETIANLVGWDRNPVPPHGYFQTGQLDKLAGPVNPYAFASSPCSIIITITGTGPNPDWGLQYIKVNSTADIIQPITFHIGQWVTYRFHVNKCSRLSKATTASGIKGSLAI